jgi:DNA-binding NarL/FixJ family response regulator
MIVFCLQCGSNCCLHLQASHRTLLTSREVSILRDLVDPQFGPLKEIAFHLGLAIGTVKVYVSHIYHKLGWNNGTLRQLTLWAIAHREQLGFTLPTAEQFPEVRPAGGCPG